MSNDRNKSEKSAMIGMSLYAWFIAIGTIYSLVLPSSLEAYPSWASEFSERFVDLVSSISEFEKVSIFPVVTRFFLVGEWLSVPVLVVLLLRRPELVKPKEKLLVSGARWKLILALILGAYIFIWWPMVMKIDPEVSGQTLNKLAIRSVGQSRIWLGVIGSSVIFALSYWIALIASYVRALLFGIR